MKRFILAICPIFCILFFVQTANAIELFPYKSQQAQAIQGTVKTNGCTDIITLPANDEFNIIDELFRPSTAVALPVIALALDPYVIPVDGVNYVMVKDKKTNDWSEKDLLGIDDPKDNMFLSLRSLESDGNYAKLTPSELKKAGVRLVKLNADGTLLVNDRKQDFDLNKIDYIDMLKLKQTANSENTGVFGHFNVYLKTKGTSKKMTVGYVTFDTHSNLKILFK